MKRTILIEIGLLFIGILITGLLCVSSWNFSVEHVDESELTYHAVGFLGGDLNPYWYGYGSLSMYILGVLYWIIGHFYIFIGKFSSIESYASQLLYNGHHTSVARFLYTLFSVYGTILYIRVGKKIGVQWPFLIFLIIGYILSEDAIVYANYLRVDQLVSLWVSVLVAAYVFIDKSNAYKPFYIISVIALATVSKISALALLPVFLFVLLTQSITIRQKIKQLGISAVLFIIITSVLQPYNNIILTIVYTLTTHVQPNEISLIGGYANAQFSIIDRVLGLIEILNTNVSILFVAPLLLFPFLYKLDKRLFYFLLILLLSTTIPLLLSIKTINYWFIPSFNLIRFIAILNVFALYKYFDSTWVKRSILLLFSLLLINYSYNRFKRYQLITHEITRANNITDSKKWIESEILGKSNILIDDLWYTNLPKIYGNSSIDEAKNISRFFIYDRYKNAFLTRVFDEFYARYISQYYSEDGAKYSVRLHSIINTEAYNSPNTTYILVSPNTYNVFINDTNSIFEQEASYFERRAAYMYLFNNSELIKTFDQGTGGVVEVYKLNQQQI